MAALDLTQFTLTNPNALVTAVAQDSLTFNGQTHDGAATRLSKTITATSGSFEYSFGFAPDSYGSYRRTILMARSSGTAHPKSADVGASAYFVELYINGSSFEYLVGYNQEIGRASCRERV